MPLTILMIDVKILLLISKELEQILFMLGHKYLVLIPAIRMKYDIPNCFTRAKIFKYFILYVRDIS